MDYVLCLEFYRTLMSLIFAIFIQMYTFIYRFFSYCNKEPTHSCIGENHSSVKLWCSGKADDFCKNIDKSAVISIDNKLHDLSILGKNINQGHITNITRELCDVFSKAARITFGLKYNKNFSSDNTNTMNKKPWFNGECRSARKNFHLAKRIHKKCQSSENKDNLKEMSKNYKHTIDKCIKGYETDLTKKLKNLRSTNSKEYWKILNTSKSSNKCAIYINNIFNY